LKASTMLAMKPISRVMIPLYFLISFDVSKSSILSIFLAKEVFFRLFKHAFCYSKYIPICLVIRNATIGVFVEEIGLSMRLLSTCDKKTVLFLSLISTRVFNTILDLSSEDITGVSYPDWRFPFRF